VAKPATTILPGGVRSERRIGCDWKCVLTPPPCKTMSSRRGMRGGRLSPQIASRHISTYPGFERNHPGVATPILKYDMVGYKRAQMPLTLASFKRVQTCLNSTCFIFNRFTGSRFQFYCLISPFQCLITYTVKEKLIIYSKTRRKGQFKTLDSI
jgi:hypothetical protein